MVTGDDDPMHPDPANLNPTYVFMTT
uniref:Uncharacterized protein n=1 Tax=Arundo donax TaxID=35708 RepID=A0A0A9C699_ARUDO